MKYLVIIFLSVIALKASSQTIDTSFHYCVAVQVQPVVLQVNYPTLDTCTHLGIVKKNFDYVTNQTEVIYYWGNPLRNVKGGTYIINDTNERTTYQILQLLADFLSLTFK